MGKRTKGYEVAEPVAPLTELVPEVKLWGFGMEKNAEGRYLAYRLSNQGDVEILTPTRHGTDHGESRHSAAARLMQALRRSILAPDTRRVVSE